jgi:hypothetical protein
MGGSDAAAHRGARFHVGAFAVAVLLALAETWPLATVLTTHYPMQRHPVTGAALGTASSDQLLTSWILASNVRRFGEDPLGVFETNNMTPFRRTLAYSENLLGVTAAVWPVQALWNNPVLTDNVALLFTLAMSAYGVLLLVHELTGSGAAALAGGALATYAPFVWAFVDQIHVTAGLSSALAWFALARLVRTRRWRWAVALGALTSWQIWASLHWGLFLALGLASGVPVLLALSAEARRALPQLLLAGVLAVALTVPLALPYAAVGREIGLRDSPGIVFLYLPWLVFPPLHAPFGYLVDRLGRGVRQNVSMTLAPWIAMGAGLAASVLRRRPRVLPVPILAALAVSGVVDFWYACGPQEWFGVPSLYTAVSAVPGLGIVRAPARAVVYTSLVIAVLGGCGVGALVYRLESRLLRVAVVALVLAVGVVEAGWKPAGTVEAPPRPPAVTAALAALPAGCAIAEIPDDFVRQGLALFRSTAHWRPLVNGRSGFYPVSPFVEAWFLNQFPAPVSTAYLNAAGACAVIVHLDTPTGRVILGNSNARRLRVTSMTPTEYLVAVPDEPPPPEGERLERDGWRVVEPASAGVVLDGDLDTVAAFAVADTEPLERLTVDLGRPTPVAGLDVALGSAFRHYLWTYRVEGSDDGTQWRSLGESAVALPPLASYRVDPQAIVQRLRFPAADVRYLRLGPVRPRPTGNVLAPDAGFMRWGIAELNVRGAPPDGKATS